MAAGERNRELDFVSADGVSVDRKGALAAALLKAQADLHLARLLIMIFDFTREGTSGSLKKTYAQLAARPWGLCCGERTARRKVTHALKLGLIAMAPTNQADGGDDANEYRIDWEGVARFLNGRTPVVTQTTPVVTQTTPGVTVTTPLRNTPSSLPLFLQSPPTPNVPSRCDAASPSTWSGAAGALKELGFQTADALVGELAAHGREPAELWEAIETYRANAAAFRSIGAVAVRLRTGRWPVSVPLREPAAERRRTAEQEARHAVDRKQRDGELRAAEADRVRRAELQRRWGLTIDGLSDEQLVEALEQVGRTAMARIVREQGRDAPFARTEIAEALESSANIEPSTTNQEQAHV